MNHESLWSAPPVQPPKTTREDHPSFKDRHKRWVSIFTEHPTSFWVYGGLIMHYRMKKASHYRLLLHSTTLAPVYKDIHHYISRRVSIDIVEPHHMYADALKEQLSFANDDIAVVFQEDETCLPYRAERFHAMYAVLSSTLLADVDLFLKEANRLLFAQGRLVMTVPPPSSAIDHPLNRKLLRYQIRQRGFSHVVILSSPRFATYSQATVWYKKLIFSVLALVDQLIIAPFSKRTPLIVIADK